LSAPVTTPVNPAGRPAVTAQQSWRADLARSAAAPVICAIALIGLLSAYVGLSGARTARVQIQVTLAAFPLRAFVGGSAGTRPTGAYLTVRNLSDSADELTGASTPAARRAILTRHAGVGATAAGAGHGSAVASLAMGAHSIVTLSPFGSDVVLLGAARLRIGQHVPLTLTFRHAGRVTVEATVTAPGTP
jgi:copper(I)-binding protein